MKVLFNRQQPQDAHGDIKGLFFNYENMEQVLKEIVSDNNVARFSHAIAGVLYYTANSKDALYRFPVDMNDKDDVGTATFPSTIKAITLMRYIRKAIKNNEMIKL
jgi:hypothetical protein